ncbi:type VI secretion system lipoprotein TssJ [Photobacterium atrarenae]|uniref:Type VI secretion system lipoprotein TssJ n=1 Tax=Photobacterium atrarenae TaxID=865757 RepID=A0ABY5GD31_9GAMM|nr:type VI secretion system lipoprotein TssJ [Photobacterium atrarenae]UTV26502.1 type VI secretion system lipoprotein TssJ [Photobacterium atrarenae]
MKNFAVLLVSLILLSGCTVANYVVPAYTKLEFSVSEEVNPDLNGRPSPVVVKVYELSSRTLFENHHFFELYDEPEKVLGPDLIARDEFEFYPGSENSYDVTLQPGVRYAGILVAYRDLENARWREIVEIDNTDYETYQIDVGKLAVSVLNK